MKIIDYARVSSEGQDAEDKVSIDQQLSDMQALCERNGWEIVGSFVDKENYKATQSPKKGRIVNPSGERADRPKFLAMLEEIKTGKIDGILCWRDDRLVRHPRVAVALEDALDIGDAQRNGKGKIQIYDATGATIDRFTLSIKATIWREENKRRAERVKLGKIGTLKDGRWPGRYPRLGYTTRKEPGKRGNLIVRVNHEAAIIERIFGLCDAGCSLREIRRKLITEGANQKGNYPNCRYEWSPALISAILHCEDYTGQATWDFGDGESYTITIPQIVPNALWQRVQKRLDQNRNLSTRNASGVYLLQGLLRCGDCGNSVRVSVVRYNLGRQRKG